LSGNWRTDLRTTGDRSRVRHNRLSDASRSSSAARDRARALSPMNTVCRASVSDAAHFSAPQRDALQSITTPLLGGWRGFAVVFFSLCALVQNAITVPFVRRSQRLEARAAWLHRWCRFACRVLGIRITTHGLLPSSGLLVSNHLSYLDIVVLSFIRP